MEPEITQDRCRCRISAVVDGKEVGYLTYSIGDGGMDIEHTVVDPACRGKGIAGMMVDRAESFAAEEGLKLTASCSYAAKRLADGRR